MYATYLGLCWSNGVGDSIIGMNIAVSLAEKYNKLVFKSVYGSFCGILEMNMGGNKLIRVFLKEVLLEEIKSFIIHNLDIDLVPSSCEFAKEFLDPFVDTCT